ncbi:MAG: hypothetical protein R2911_04035 [Caldilineaceae bacterium]
MTQLFTIFLNILAPVFTLVLIGYIIGPRLQIEARSISRIAYFLLAPLLSVQRDPAGRH